MLDTATRNSAKSTLRLRIRSLVCLCALVLLQLPAISVAAMAITGACCSTDNCPIAAHHHPMPAKAQQAPMDCDHSSDNQAQSHSAAKMRHCSMSCCQTTEQSAIHGHFFLLSPELDTAALSPISENLLALAVSEPSGFLSLFSPPPESL